MTSALLELASTDDARDFSTFLQRAKRLGCEHVAVSASSEDGGIFSASVGVLTKQGLLDTSPNIIGGRTGHVTTTSWHGSIVVEIAAVLDRLARGTSAIALPVPQPGVAWAGVSAPRDDWQPVGLLSEDALRSVARAGITAVADANGLGVRIVEEVRHSTWNAPLATLETGHIVPAGAAFAALGLGFIDDEPLHSSPTGLATSPQESERYMRVTVNGKWMRISNERGHVLIR